MNATAKGLLYLVGLAAAGYGGWYIGQHKPVEQTTEDVVATVNGKGLPTDWFIEQMKLRGGMKPGQFHTTEQKQALLDYLINEEVLYQQALEEGVGENPSVARLYKKAVIDKYLTDQLERQLEKVKVGNQEVETHFNNNQTVYNKPARRRAAILEAKVSDSDDEATKLEQKAKMEKALAAVTELPQHVLHFGELAKVYSDDRASMYQGGVIGWLINHPDRTYRWDQALIEALFALDNPGDTSGVIETDSGFYVVRLVAAEQVKEKSFDQVKKGIKNQILQQKRQALKANFMENILADADISINQQNLEAIPALSPKAKNQDKTPPAMPQAGGAQ